MYDNTPFLPPSIYQSTALISHSLMELSETVRPKQRSLKFPHSQLSPSFFPLTYSSNLFTYLKLQEAFYEQEKQIMQIAYLNSFRAKMAICVHTIPFF